jgi:hypothetical protein
MEIAIAFQLIIIAGLLGYIAGKLDAILKKM